jgi:inorganic pyrophosphatase
MTFRRQSGKRRGQDGGGMNVSQMVPARDPKTGLLNVIVEAPRGTRNKFKYDDHFELFRLSKMLPAGASFPFDFGFIPSTRAEDGDPLDILVLTDEPTAVGSLLPVRLLGVIEAEQTERGKTLRNDRLVGVIETPYNLPEARDMHDLGSSLLDEIEHFFVSYNESEGRQFKPIARRGASAAEKLIAEALRRRKLAGNS